MPSMIATALGRLADHTVSEGDIVVIEPDRVMSHDNTAFIIDRFRAIGCDKVWNREKIAVIFDHCVPAETPGFARNHTTAREFVRAQGISHFFDAGIGVCHQVMMERGLVLPGQVVLGADSHSTIYGAMNAAGIPINRTEMAGIWATGEIWLRVPQVTQVRFTGAFEPGVYAKDLCLAILRKLGAAGANYRCLEFTGTGIGALSMSERMTIANMAVELGAKAAIFPFDDETRRYLDTTAGAPFTPLPDTDGPVEGSIEFDLASISPKIACPHDVENVRDLADLIGTRVQYAYLGSCTNGRLDDLRIAAALLSGHRVAPGVRLVVFPASREVRDAAAAEGVLQTLRDAGAEIMTASCGPCFGAVGSILKPGETCISSSNRNFRGRMGSPDAGVYLASPAVVAASAVRGEISDPREFLT